MPGYEEINKEARWGQLCPLRGDGGVMRRYFQCDTADRNVTGRLSLSRAAITPAEILPFFLSFSIFLSPQGGHHRQRGRLP
ncbi:hypothetical protein TYRP_023791, partial [Tyrophagus putrescentiae]